MRYSVGYWQLDPWNTGRLFDIRKFVRDADNGVYDGFLDFTTDDAWYECLKCDVDRGLYDYTTWNRVRNFVGRLCWVLDDMLDWFACRVYKCDPKYFIRSSSSRYGNTFVNFAMVIADEVPNNGLKFALAMSMDRSKLDIEYLESLKHGSY